MRPGPLKPPAFRRWIFPIVTAVLTAGIGFSQQENSTTPPKPGAVSADAVTTTPPVTTAGKASKQIRVRCENQNVRLTFSSFGDNVDRELRQLLRDSSDWVFPIRITVKGTLSDLPSGPSTVTPPIDLLPDGQFSLQLGIRLSTAFDREAAARELLRLLLYERMLRPFRSDPGGIVGKRVNAPPWLLYGVEELIAHRRAGRPSSFYAGIIQARQVLSVEEILNGDPSSMDPLSATVYKASSAALIAALLDQPQGPPNFRQFVEDLAGVDAGKIEALLRQHFPGLRISAGAIEKWWSLQVAHMGRKSVFEFLSAEETEALLGQALVVRFGTETQEDPKGLVGKFLPRLPVGQPFEGTVHDFEKFLGRKDAAGVLHQSRLKLRNLSMRCFPLYRNVVTRYEAAVILLAQGKKRGIKSELKAIDRAWAGAAETMRRVTDYVNYYEATRAEGKSEAFENFRKTRRKIEERRKPERKDRISKTLDFFDTEFEEADP